MNTQRSSQANAQPQLAWGSLSGCLNVLYAEDEDEDAFLFEMVLRQMSQPYGFHRVHEGGQALRYLLGLKEYADRSCFPFPDILVSDLKMAGMGAYELIQKMRAYPQFNSLPIVILSSSNLEYDQHVCLQAGVVGYFVKPGAVQQWRATVERIIHLASEAAPGLPSCCPEL